MHSHITSDTEGTCPICGMNLEPVELEETMDELTINVTGSMQQALAIRTTFATLDNMSKIIKTVGEVEYNQRAINNVHSRSNGWIIDTNVESIGDKVEKGQLLYTIYSTDLLVAQQDYILALTTSINKNQLIKSSTMHLQLLGVSDKEINELKRTKTVKTNMPIYSKYSGVVTDIDFKRGAYININKKILTITDLSNVWVSAYLFAGDYNWVELNQNVTVSSSQSKDISTKIDYIYPELEAKTRSLKIRMIVENNGELKPNMLMQVNIKGKTKYNIIIIPQESLIQTGKANRVIIKTTDSGFVARDVVVGDYSNGNVEIISGIKAGDEIVISGQFLLDSESSLKGGLIRMGGGHNDH